MEASSNYLLKVPSPNTITSRGRPSTYDEGWSGHISGHSASAHHFPVPPIKRPNRFLQLLNLGSLRFELAKEYGKYNGSQFWTLASRSPMSFFLSFGFLPSFHVGLNSHGWWYRLLEAELNPCYLGKVARYMSEPSVNQQISLVDLQQTTEKWASPANISHLGPDQQNQELTYRLSKNNKWLH